MSKEDLDLVSKLSPEELAVKKFQMQCISPDESKYAESADLLRPYLSFDAEWKECANFQGKLIATRNLFGQATEEQVRDVLQAIGKIDTLNIALLEKMITRHDQLAVLEEIGRHLKDPKTKALLHPGTTSYCILDTARSSLFGKAWKNVLRPQVSQSINVLADRGIEYIDLIQIGRTHLQDTSPVPFGVTLAGFSARMAERVERLDDAFGRLRGKVSGIVGTGAGIEMVIGKGRALDFEIEALKLLGLKPDYTATQIVQKEALTDVGHGLTSLMYVLGNFSNDMRMLYSSAIGEITSLDAQARLGGSSAAAGKNNPINWENMSGKVAIVESGMRVLYEMMRTDFQRDLRNSVQARYQPQSMIAQTFEAFGRLNKELPQLYVIPEGMERNLQPYRDMPDEAMVTILRGEQWVHPEHGVGHDFVKKMARMAKKERRKLLDVSLEDGEFKKLYMGLPDEKRDILNGRVELYVGPSKDKARRNIEYAREVAGRKL